MKLSDLFDYRHSFYSESEVKDYIKKSKKYSDENPQNAKILNFFITSKQRTYLVFTDKNIYCILDNSKEQELNINWSESINMFSNSDKIDHTVKTKDNTYTTGLVDFGPNHKNWYYTKELFKESSIQEQLKEIISTIIEE
jgi:hypothetical protein